MLQHMSSGAVASFLCARVIVEAGQAEPHIRALTIAGRDDISTCCRCDYRVPGTFIACKASSLTVSIGTGADMA